MNFHLSLLTKTTLSGLAITATLGCLAPSADALTLASSSGSWSNVRLDNGITVNPPGGNTVEFLTVGNESQVRWGDPVSFGDKSGLGFVGVTSQSFDVGEMFEVGTLRHFNQSVTQPFATQADLGITLDFSTPSVSQTFNWIFDINETINQPPPACPVGDPPCADIVTFPDAFPTETFSIGGVEYTLKLLGFRDPVTGEPVEKFVSPENGRPNSATLFAKITTPPSEKVPEPTAMVGLGLLGLYLLGRRNQKQKLH
ncbi:MAG: THxN family PEP-CTERM protein [Coleofasciculus chthonoplastes F3-SA18-01]|uniref:THxN family PEP-CTERM protein n=1 Tax=Coleofasciculus chthonoplastes TaxID=64178 RepID=UPI0032F2745E